MSEQPKPCAWLCELAEEDGTTRSQFVEQDPDGLRWNDIGEPSPFRVTPLYDQAALDAAVAAAIERCVLLVENYRARPMPTWAREELSTLILELKDKP